MKSSIEIRNEVRDLDDKIAKATADFNAAEGDAKDAFRDAINEFKGRQSALNDMLDDVLAEEDRIRKGGGIPMASNPVAKKPFDVARAFLGDRAAFDKAGGLVLGTKVNVSKFLNDGDHTFELAIPTRTDYRLPDNVLELPMGVIDVVEHARTDANLTYMAQGAFTNAAADWTPGTTKPESDESWTEKSMNLFTTAHWIAVSKQTAHHYGQLDSLIRGDLMYGLRVKEAADLISKDAGDGKKGMIKDPDIQTYTAKKGEKFYDSARRMITAAWMKSGYRPTHFGVHPLVLEQLDLEKDSVGAYLRLFNDGRIWGIRVVEDVNLVSGGVGTEKYGAMAFNRFSATWYTSETDALTVGYVNDQLIRNEYTLLAEGEHGIAVPHPKSIVYLADAITPGA